MGENRDLVRALLREGLAEEVLGEMTEFLGAACGDPRGLPQRLAGPGYDSRFG